jgi:hypothetical protein
MKILKYVIYVLLALLVIFFAFGLLKPTISYGHEISTSKSVKEAWAVTQDESKYSQWLEGFKSIELIEGEKGAVGSKYKVIVNPGEGQPEFEMIETVISLVDNDHVNLHFDSDMMDFDQVISVRESDGKTYVKTESTVGAKGIMMKSMFAMMETLGGTFQSQEEKNINALKKVIDENTTDYFPAPAIINEELIIEE